MPGQTSVVLMGSLSAASDGFDFLTDHPRFDLLGVVCRDDDKRHAGESYVIDRARKRGVPVFSVGDMPSADLGLAIRFDRVLKPRHLAQFRLGVVNLHGAPLPEMRGSRCECAAILEKRTAFGVSLHLMDKGLDTGAILCVERFGTGADATAGALLREANQRGMNLIRSHLEAYVDGRIDPAPQDEAEGRTYREAELMAVRNAPLPWNPIKRDRVRRAFHYGPGMPDRRPGALRRLLRC